MRFITLIDYDIEIYYFNQQLINEMKDLVSE